MIDLKEVANNLSDEKVIKLVTDLGADRYIDKEDCIIFPTICHNVNPEEASMKLYYYKKNKRFHCYTSCGDNFNIYTLFERRYKLLGKEYNFFKDIVLVIAENVETQSSINSFIAPYKSDFDIFNKAEISVDIEPINPSILNVYSFYPTIEWLNNGITEEAMHHYNILYSISENKIIIPHYDLEGKLIGIRGRALNEEDLIYGKYMPVKIEGKYYAHPLGYNLYGLNIVRDNIKRMHMAIIAEAEKSCMQAESILGVNNNIVVASCGSSISNYQIDLLINCGAKKILIAYDKEGQDWKEKEEYYNKLKNFCIEYRNKVQMGFIWDNKNFLELKDSPFDRGKDTFLKLYKGAIWL